MTKKKNNKKEESDYCDDCAVCLYMKSIEEGKKPPTLSEMKDAFRKSRENGAVVGGEMFEKEN